MTRIAQNLHKPRGLVCVVSGRQNWVRLPLFLIAPVRFLGGRQLDICNLEAETAFSQSARRNSYLRSRGTKRVIRNPSPGIGICVWAPQNRHLRIGQPKVEKRKPGTETEKVKPEARFCKSGLPTSKSENRLRAIESVKVTWRPRFCKSECHGLSLAFRVPRPKVCNCESPRPNLHFGFRDPKPEKWIGAAGFGKVTFGRQNVKSGCQPVALDICKPVVQARNVRTGRVKVQKRVCSFGIAKVRHRNGLGASNNAVFRRIETERERIVHNGARFAGNRCIRTESAAFAGYATGVR